MKNGDITISYRLQSIINELREDVAYYLKRSEKNDYVVERKQRQINSLEVVSSVVKEIEPIGLLLDIARKIKINALLETDLTIIIVPNRDNVPPYPYALIGLEDLSGCGIPDTLGALEMHRDGIASIEVEDYSGSNISDVIALHANRGDLYADTKKRKEALGELPNDF